MPAQTDRPRPYRSVLYIPGSKERALEKARTLWDVQPGDLIRKGQVIARVGRTGRATGTHLHFEVLADGRPVNPLQYISTVRGGG